MRRSDWCENNTTLNANKEFFFTKKILKSLEDPFQYQSLNAVIFVFFSVFQVVTNIFISLIQLSNKGISTQQTSQIIKSFTETLGEDQFERVYLRACVARLHSQD